MEEGFGILFNKSHPAGIFKRFPACPGSCHSQEISAG